MKKQRGGLFSFASKLAEIHADLAFKKKHGRRMNDREWAKEQKQLKHFRQQIGRGKKLKKSKIKNKNRLKPKKDSLYSESVIVNGLKYTRPT